MAPPVEVQQHQCFIANVARCMPRAAANLPGGAAFCPFSWLCGDHTSPVSGSLFTPSRLIAPATPFAASWDVATELAGYLWKAIDRQQQ